MTRIASHELVADRHRVESHSYHSMHRPKEQRRPRLTRVLVSSQSTALARAAELNSSLNVRRLFSVGSMEFRCGNYEAISK